jgi:hypothetical protein
MPLPADGAGAAAEPLPYPESREITFNNFCEPCDKKAEARITPEERAARQQRSAAVNREIENLKATGPLGALGMGNVVKLGKQAAQEEERLREEERRKQRPESYTRWRMFMAPEDGPRKCPSISSSAERFHAST